MVCIQNFELGVPVRNYRKEHYFEATFYFGVGEKELVPIVFLS